MERQVIVDVISKIDCVPRNQNLPQQPEEHEKIQDDRPFQHPRHHHGIDRQLRHTITQRTSIHHLCCYR